MEIEKLNERLINTNMDYIVENTNLKLQIIRLKSTIYLCYILIFILSVLYLIEVM